MSVDLRQTCGHALEVRKWGKASEKEVSFISPDVGHTEQHPCTEEWRVQLLPQRSTIFQKSVLQDGWRVFLRLPKFYSSYSVTLIKQCRAVSPCSLCKFLSNIKIVSFEKLLWSLSWSLPFLNSGSCLYQTAVLLKHFGAKRAVGSIFVFR